MIKILTKILRNRIKGEFLKTKEVTINKTKFFLPRFDYSIYPNLITKDIWMIDLLKQVCPKVNGTFLDVGVNVGQTLLKLKSVKELNYIGFEPNINCVFYLHNLVMVNKFENVQIIPTAISNKCGITKLNFRHGILDSSATMVEDFRDHETGSFWITTTEIDNVEASIDLKNISILKIDVEGSELEVMESFKKIILRDKPYIFLEVLPCYEENSERYMKQKYLEDFIKKIDYKIFRIIKTKNKFNSLKSVSDFGIHSNLNWSDYLIRPSGINFEGIKKK